MTHGPLRVGIGGPVGAGKTTLTEKLARALGPRLSMAVIMVTRSASAFMRARSGTETFLRSCAELVMKLWASLDRGATHPDAACNLAIGRRLPKARGSTCCERHIAWPKAVGHRSR